MEIRCNALIGGQDAIQSAINALPAEGGTVIIPSGIWHTGPLTLRSDLILYLEEGAEVIFSDNMQDYLPPVFTRWEGVECYNFHPLIYANGCENISILGSGTFNGSGKAWWPWKKTQGPAAERLVAAEANGICVEDRVFGPEDALRPSFLQLVDCRHVLLRDFYIIDGPQWTIHPVYCEDVRAIGVTIRTDGPNTDGFNPDSCRDVLIEACHFTTGDDCIAINSGMNEDGQRVARPCENIEIRRCYFHGGHAAIAIGSGMSGGVQNVHVTDCLIDDTERGIRIKSMPGRGGYVKDICFEHLHINNVEKEAIQLTMHYDASTVIPKANTLPEFSDITLCDIVGSGADTAVALTGLPDSPLRGVTMTDIRIDARHPDVLEYVV